MEYSINKNVYLFSFVLLLSSLFGIHQDWQWGEGAGGPDADRPLTPPPPGGLVMLGDDCNSTLPPPEGNDEPHFTDFHFNEMNSNVQLLIL